LHGSFQAFVQPDLKGVTKPRPVYFAVRKPKKTDKFLFIFD